MSSRVRALALCVLGSFVVSCGGVEGPPPDEVAAGKGDWLSGLELSVKRHVDDLHGEPQVIPDCANSALKIAPCQQVSARLLSWLNASGKCFK